MPILHYPAQYSLHQYPIPTFRPDMRLHGGSTHEEDEFHRDIVVGVLKQTADVARERVVDTVATAAAVAETRRSFNSY